MKHLRKVDSIVHRNWVVAILICIVFFLRLPNFFEPYWYGDEAIYLTLGTAMRHGERLYAEIIDHKTPLIYYFAMTPTQFWFRVEFFGLMVISTIFFFDLAQKLLKKKRSVILSTLVFILLTTLPAFEGNIPNGELYVMFFILVGAAFFTRTEIFTHFIENKKERHIKNLSLGKLFISGVILSGGILTKVPALFDVLAFFSICWFSFISTIRDQRITKDRIIQTLTLAAGVATPILGSVIYYFLRGSLKAYIDYGLLYNFHYAGSWQLDFKSQLLLFLFTTKGKTLILAAVLLLLTFRAKLFSPKSKFVLAWSFMALYASLLSNRPYPHYFLQTFLPLSLLIGLCIEHARLHLKEKLSMAIFVVLLSTIMILLRVGLYPTISYYTRFAQLMTGAISPAAYRQSFDSLVADNERAVPLLKTSVTQNMFIWGTDPTLYAEAHIPPVGRFTVAFHVLDFHAETETMNAVINAKPTYIVVMKNEVPLPGLTNYLNTWYLPNTTFEHFVLWKRARF